MDKLIQLKNEVVKNSQFRLDEGLRMIEISLSKITEEQLWLKPNTSLNSIGNLLLHLCGNITQYGIASLQGVEDKRVRDEEFAISGGYTKTELFEKLTATVSEVKQTIHQLPLDRFLEVKEVQGFSLSGTGNIIHLVEHFSYHTGQIAFWVKQLNNQQLGFYDGVDLNKKSASP